jgi:hypothetical protein
MSHRVSAGPYTLELSLNGIAILYEVDKAGVERQLPGGIGYLDALVQFGGEIIYLRSQNQQLRETIEALRGRGVLP